MFDNNKLMEESSVLSHIFQFMAGLLPYFWVVVRIKVMEEDTKLLNSCPIENQEENMTVLSSQPPLNISHLLKWNTILSQATVLCIELFKD